MPVATSSRRTQRRQASSDIEDDRTSQSRTQEQVEDDKDGSRSRHRVNSVKKEKKPTMSRKKERTRDDVAGDDDNSDDDRIDVENFHDQPLSRADAGRLQGLSKDWNMMEKQIRPNWQVVGDAALALAETADGDEAEKSLAELDSLMKNLIDISAEMQAHEKVLDALYQRVGQGEALDNAVEQYNDGVQKEMEQYAQKTTRQKYAKSTEYAKFLNNLYEVQNPDQAMPPITDLIPKEDGDDSDDDDELEMGGVSQNYNCPITLTLLVDPVTSQLCNHSFSKEAILQSFRGTTEVKCPAAGCARRFTRADLKPNKDLAKRVKAHERRARRAAEHSDAEEIID